MSVQKVKTPTKIFTSDLVNLESLIVSTVDKVDNIVGSSLGPGGRPCLIESELPGIPNTNTKDGVTIFKSLGSENAYEHLIIEQTRDAAIKTVNEAGDGPQPLYAKVLTPTGFKAMGDIKAGMEICGTNKTRQTVLAVFPKGEKEIYEVAFGDGRVVECCADHLWNVNTSYGKNKTTTTSEMMKDFVKINKNGDKRFKYYTPTSVVDFNDKSAEMPLDPYLVGLLLGDGSLTGSGSIELSIGINKKHILDKIKIPNGLKINTSFIEHKNYYRVKISGTTNGGKTAHRIVESLGLLGSSSSTKFIPKSYLYASEETRRQLLQGLLDTDGHINGRGLFEFSTISNELCNDFLELARSLNIPINHTLHNRDNDPDSYSDTPIHRINQLKGYKYGAKITNISATGRFTEMQCLKVSNEDHLYITDNYITTHNTTTATIISAALIKNLFAFCKAHRKYSPQKVTRHIAKLLKTDMSPFIKKSSIKITNKNKDLLKKVATISANGDKEMADNVIKAFDAVGYGSSSHVTIQELSGPSSYQVELVEGFPIEKGYEESIGKFHPAFINDQAHQRCALNKPLFVLFDGNITDIVQISDILQKIGFEYAENGNADFANTVIVAHKFSDQVLTNLAFNFSNPNTINVVPLATPMSPIVNGQLQFLMDLAAFTGAKIFDMNNPLVEAMPEDLGMGMEKIEINRFRTTIVGDSDELNIQQRADDIKVLISQSESKLEKSLLEERLGKLTNGIAKLKIFGSSNGELKEKADRAEDAVCAVRAAITDGCVPGGGRVLINLGLSLLENYSEDDVVREVIVPSLFKPFYRLLDNAGYNSDEIKELLAKMTSDRKSVYDVENEQFGDPKKLGVFDATKAVEQALENAVSISSVMGTLGGIVAFPRDSQLEKQDFREQMNFERTLENASNIKNEANERG